jgi:hypothetical protein
METPIHIIGKEETFTTVHQKWADEYISMVKSNKTLVCKVCKHEVPAKGGEGKDETFLCFPCFRDEHNGEPSKNKLYFESLNKKDAIDTVREAKRKPRKKKVNNDATV